MSTHKQTKTTSAKALSQAQYRYECIRRHPDFKQRPWESLLFTRAIMSEQLKEARDVDSPRTAELAANLASTTELIEAGMRTIWPHLVRRPICTVPLYHDTTEEEWLAIYRQHKERSLLLRQRDQFFSATPTPQREPKKRIHKDDLAFRLQVFDSHQELKNFTQVGQRLGHAESNVRRAYNRVFFDIYGAGLPTKVKERRAAGFDAASHRDSCSTCRDANSTEKMCAAARAYIDVDSRALRELLIDHS